MNVIFTEAYYDSLTGAQRSMLPLVTHCNKISPHILCPSNGDFTKEVRSRNINCTVLEFPQELDKPGSELTKRSLSNYLRVGASLSYYQKKVYNNLKMCSPDLLYCNNIKSLILFGFSARMLGIPIVLYARVAGDGGILDELALLLSSTIITISDGVRSRYQSSIWNTPIETIYTGVNTEKFSRSRTQYDFPIKSKDLTDNEMFVLTQVASITPRKGQLDLLRAVSEISDKFNITVRFIGETYSEEYYQKLLDFIDHHSLEEYVEFHGWQDDVRPYYYASDATVLPSYNEGFPRTILESLAMRTPVISTDAGGTDELIKHNETGLLTPIGRPDIFAENIKKLIINHELRNRITEKGFHVVLNEFSEDIYIQNFESYIQKTYG